MSGSPWRKLTSRRFKADTWKARFRICGGNFGRPYGALGFFWLFPGLSAAADLSWAILLRPLRGGCYRCVFILLGESQAYGDTAETVPFQSRRIARAYAAVSRSAPSLAQS
jgi:hypothetical protein